MRAGVVPVRILMVCMGNICRSPAAEVVLRRKLEIARLDWVTVDSAGTGGWHEGSGADRRSESAWEKRGYSGQHTARKFRREWFDDRDLIAVMDADNYASLLPLARTEEHRAKLRYLRSFDRSLAGSTDGDALEVPDPYYGGPSGFEHMLDLIERACDGLVVELQSQVTQH